MTHQFFITVPSDSSMKWYPQNSVGRYTAQLPQPISLDGQYEVGLAEIIYPQTWYNIRNLDREYWIAIGGLIEFNGGKHRRCFLETCNYNNVNEFISSLNAQMNDAFK